MSEKKKIEIEKEVEVPEEDKAVVEAVDKDLERENYRESREEREERLAKEKLDNWVPKTQLGKDVMSKKVKNISEIFNRGLKILEPEIVDILIKPKTDLLDIGQSKGKFGGGKRRAWRQTQKKTKEGNVMTFAAMAVVGDEKGTLGIGSGRAAETLPCRDKAIRKAKLNVMPIVRGCGSFDCSCTEEHSIPHKVEGKCGSVEVVLMPAPQGTGLVAGDEIKKILKLAGIKDIYSKTFGKTRTTFNLAKACISALNKLKQVEKR